MLSFQIHGSNDSNVSETVEVLLTFFEGLLSQSPIEIFATILPGIADLENLHPLFVHFPIAFLLGFVCVEFAACITHKQQWRELASGFLYLGSISAVFTVIAGFFAEDSVEHGGNVHEIMEYHELFGFIILGLSIFLSIWRLIAKAQIKAEANILYLILSMFLAIFVILGADLGGLMVYKHGVAVEAVAKDSTVQQQFQQHLHEQ